MTLSSLKSAWVILISTFSAFIAIGMITNFIPILIFEEIVPSALVIGILSAVLWFTNAIWRIPIGYLIDKIGRFKINISGLLILGISAVFMALSRDIVIFSFLAVVRGIGSGAFIAASLISVADITQSEEMGKVVGFESASWGLGDALGSLFGGILAFYFGLSLLFIISGFLALATSLFVGLFLKETLQTKEITTKTHSRWTTRVREFFSSGLENRIICAIIMADFVAALGSASLIGFRALYLLVHYKLNFLWIGIIGSILVGIITITNPFAGYIVDKFGRKKILLIGSFGSAIATFFFAIFSSLFELIIIVVFNGLVASFYSVADNSIILEVSTSEKRGQVYGVWSTFWTLGFGIGVLLAGWIWEAYAPWIVFVSGSILIAAGGVVFLILGKETKSLR
ncbi:MAG: MFS transporter [Candidatus Sifarchaeia archaeon]